MLSFSLNFKDFKSCCVSVITVMNCHAMTRMCSDELRLNGQLSDGRVGNRASVPTRLMNLLRCQHGQLLKKEKVPENEV